VKERSVPLTAAAKARRVVEEEEVEDVMEPRVNEELQLMQILGKAQDKISDTVKYHVVVRLKRRKVGFVGGVSDPLGRAVDG
jgi:hypothetical protein